MNTEQTIPQTAICRRFRSASAYFRAAFCAVLISVFSCPVFAANTIVRMEILYGDTEGNIDIKLFDDEAPITVANFLRYAGLGYYGSNSFFNDNFHHAFVHRSAQKVEVIEGEGDEDDETVITPLTIRAGGYGYYHNPPELFLADPFGDPNRAIYEHVPQFSPIPNEFSPSRSNVHGTITMAKQTTDPDSATSEWIINLADNNGTSISTLNFDTLNGGYAVFGEVIAGMEHADAIGGLPNFPAPVFPTKVVIDGVSGIVSGSFVDLPRINYDPAGGVAVQPENLVRILNIPNVKSRLTIWGTLATFTADVDMTFALTDAVTDAVEMETLLSTFTPPSGSEIKFPSGILSFIMTGAMGGSGKVVTLRHGSNSTPNRYFAYGRTPDNAEPHWYDFTYDGTTGAEFAGNKVILHFVDGLRGDEDLLVNDSISHIGAPARQTPEPEKKSVSGCTIAAGSASVMNYGDWFFIAMFLAFIGLARKRFRH